MNDIDFQRRVVESLARLETHMEDLVGNGQPGRVAKIEGRIEKLYKWFYIGTGAGLAISALIHFVFRY